jgi:hypothetical protein
MNTKWTNFTIYNLLDDEKIEFTQEYFEEYVNDKFVAVKLNEDGSPLYIWTEKYCFIIYSFRKILIGTPAMIGVPRNPE